MNQPAPGTASAANAAVKPRGKRMTAGRLTIMVNLLTLSAVGLGLGLIGPCMTIVPSAGQDLDLFIRLFAPDDLEPRTYSILGGIDALRHSPESGSALVAALLFGFSVIFPTLKLAVMAWGAAALRLGVRPHAAVKLTSHLGKFSMLDVMVLGLLVLAIKGLPGDTVLHLNWAVWAFAVSILLSMAGSVVMHKVRPWRAEVMKRIVNSSPDSEKDYDVRLAPPRSGILPCPNEPTSATCKPTNASKASSPSRTPNSG